MIEMVEIELLRPSPTNPRKHFDQERLAQLAGNIALHGVIQALLVRPAWCVGWAGGPEPAAKDESYYEIVAGERRYRAAKLAGRPDVPVTVRPLNDREALELQLIENLQREDLDALEEADGIHALLALRDEHGEAIYTVKSIAATVGKTAQHIYARLKLLDLPEFAKAALKKGEITASLGEVIAKVPDPELRARAGKEIINGYAAGPMTKKEAIEHIATKYMRSIRSGGFDPEDATLDPTAGPCTTCAHLAKNADVALAGGDLRSAGARGDVCLNTACLDRKTLAAHAQWKAKHGGEGRKVLSPDDNARLVKDNNFVFLSSGIVSIDDVPPPDVRTGPGLEKKTWRELIKDRDVEVIVGRTKKGRAIEGVRMNEAIEAARLNGYGVQNPSAPREAATVRVDKRARDDARKINYEVLVRIVSKLKTGVKADLGDWLRRALAPIVESEMPAIGKFLDLDEKAVRVELESGVPVRLCSLAAVALLMHHTNHDQHVIGEDGLAMLADLQIDPDAIRAEIVAERDRKVLIDVHDRGFYVALKVAGKVTVRKGYARTEALVAFVKESGAQDVVIDCAFRTEEVVKLADAHGWRAVSGSKHAAELAEIEEATEPLHPKRGTTKGTKVTKKKTAAKAAKKKGVK